jgi:RNA polymerase sigma-70 factor (ECF subfamily)
MDEMDRRTPSAAPEPHPRDDGALREAMDRYAAGDDAAFEVLYDSLAPRLRAMLRRKGCDAAQVEDLIQQTFLRIHLARAHYHRGQQVVPWVFAIARHLLIDAWRHSQYEQRRPEQVVQQPPTPDEALIADETARELARELEALPARNREAFSLVKLDGLSLEQAAQVLGTTVTAIKLRIHRTYRALRSAAQEPK